MHPSETWSVALRELKQIEGGYSNNPADSGGETNFGVTLAVARAYGYTGAMKDMPRQVAERIYRERYWDALRLDDVAAHSTLLARRLFDIAVNCGQPVAGKWLQRSLNALNNRQGLYRDIATDGAVGRMTIAALGEYARARGARGLVVLWWMLTSLQGEHYLSLAEAREKDEEFLYGWFANRIVSEV